MTAAPAGILDVSVIVETFTLTHEYPGGTRIEDSQLPLVLARLEQQTYSRDRYEIVVELDSARQDWAVYLHREFPDVRVAFAPQATYFGMKNHGFENARAPFIALVDGDCIPNRDWIEKIAAALNGGLDVIVGKTRYRPGPLLAETFSVFDFGHVHARRSGGTFSFNANNVAFRKEVVRQHQFDSKAPRNGACYFLWRKLDALHYRMHYDPSIYAGHGDDFKGLGFVRKHFERGFDAISLCRLDTENRLDGTRYLRLGILAPLGMYGARVLFDLRRFIGNRLDLQIPLYAIPYYCVASVLIRGIEAAGGIASIVNPGMFQGEH
jgi:hypothetical protein